MYKMCSQLLDARFNIVVNEAVLLYSKLFADSSRVLVVSGT